MQLMVLDNTEKGPRNAQAIMQKTYSSMLYTKVIRSLLRSSGIKSSIITKDLSPQKTLERGHHHPSSNSKSRGAQMNTK